MHTCALLVILTQYQKQQYHYFFYLMENSIFPIKNHAHSLQSPANQQKSLRMQKPHWL